MLFHRKMMPSKLLSLLKRKGFGQKCDVYVPRKAYCNYFEKGEIPVINFNGSAELDKNITGEVQEALRSVGFMYIKNAPTINETLISRSLKQGQWLFNLQAMKKNVFSTNEDNARGYYVYQGVGLGEERTKDNIEAFVIGKETSSPKVLKEEYLKRINSDGDLMITMRKNQWPKVTDSDIFKRDILECYDALSKTSALVLQAIARSLQLDSSHFASYHDKNDHTMELKLYPALKKFRTPPGNKSAGSFQHNNSLEGDDLDNDGADVRVKTHADLSSITLLLQNDVDGLQVRSNSGNWINARYIPNAVLINTGDIMKIWTNGAFPSTKHRVIATSQNEERDRYSIVYFCTPNWDSEIKPLGSNSQTKPVLFGDLTPFQ